MERDVKRLAIGYTRRSKKSEAQNVSLDVQNEAILTYCKQQGLCLVFLISQDGVSGADRARYAEIESAVETYNPRALVVYHLDRFARDSVGGMAYLESLVKRGIELHVCGSGQVKFETAEEKLIARIQAVINEFQRDNTAQKTRHALQHIKANGGKYTRLPPFGYEYDGKFLRENSAEQLAIDLLKQYRAQRFGIREARKLLLATGYSGRSSLKMIHRFIKENNL